MVVVRVIEKLRLWILGLVLVCGNPHMTEDGFHFQRMVCTGRDEVIERTHFGTENAPECPEKYGKLRMPW